MRVPVHFYAFYGMAVPIRRAPLLRWPYAPGCQVRGLVSHTPKAQKAAKGGKYPRYEHSSNPFPLSALRKSLSSFNPCRPPRVSFR
jgi:hypothetical protein